MEKINYVIATWAGPRRAPNKNYLKNHLIKLLSLKNNLSQITIVRPPFSDFEKSYYDVESLISKFDTKIVFLDKNNNDGQSYGQLFFTYETYRDEFDYYIFMEDDYIPNIDYFDGLLLDEYKSQNFEGYLCSYSGVDEQTLRQGCSVSNGIISTKTFEKIYEKIPNPIQMLSSPEGWMCHVNFGKLIYKSNLSFRDFGYKYKVPYFGNEIVNYGNVNSDKTIIVPTQMLDIDFHFREMELKDLDSFLKIRNECRNFLHNNEEFSLSQTKEWFEKYNPKFFVIMLNNFFLGYFRTSNWEDNSLYIGCDIDSSLRGLGLGYLSYLKFMDFLRLNYGIKKFKLEVLSTNIRAISLYKKLGFEIVGVAEEKIFRDNTEIESIIMEFKL